jgi:hypothetical protein
VPFQRIDVRGPELPELGEPGVDLLERFRPEAVEPALGVYGGLHKSGFSQDAQVLGDGWLGHSKLPLDLTDRLFGGYQQAQDGSAIRFGDDLED